MSLFQTKAWQDSWWETWGHTRGFTLLSASDGQISGLYEDSYRFRGFLPVRSLQFVGTSNRRINTPRTEYNTLMPCSHNGTDARTVLEQALVQNRWSEAALTDIRKDSIEFRQITDMAKRHRWLHRVISEDTAYSVNTSGDFEAYLSKLGANTRLRLFNRRKVFESLGEVELCEFWPNRTDEFFKLLDDLIMRRWGKPSFGGGEGMAFQRRFLERVVAEGGVPNLSILKSNGRALSALYNVAFNGRMYNIHSGFEENFNKKLALGTLHIGYNIEECFHRDDIAVFDLLVGTGKNEDYKCRIADRQEPLASIMLVRSPVFKFLYLLKDRKKRRSAARLR
ncbi:GNAT family N-acetyltransferase [Marinobacter sp. SS21]|uniref:GNAT family N-acetyltransferase n=1 Tax=Marinobacter sp. SS21 TaxID=2979460 RepID=UPI00233054B1|nr:GNAT family N-acetyltransferase [Marinobacter sp. SS21]MDC0661951.1 GNAT family N-acetyltransferase [Marinobacter sp. SS21]